MLRPCLNSCRHLTRAIVVLVVVLLAIEICLHLAATDEEPASVGENRLLEPSLQTHHRMRPLVSLKLPHPDAEKPVTVRTNSLGLRGPEPAVPKPVGTFRIVCLGDESILGLPVEESETVCGVLQELLQSQSRFDVEVVNAGVPQYCPLLSYLQVKHQLASLDPDLYVIHFDMSDVWDDYRHRRRTYVDADDAPLACPAAELASGQSGVLPLSDRFLITRRLKQAIGDSWKEQGDPAEARSIEGPHGIYAWLQDRSPKWDVYVDHALSAVVHLRDLAEASGSRLLLVTSPLAWQVSAEATDAEGVRAQFGVADGLLESDAPFERIEWFARSEQIPFFNATPGFRRAPQPERLFLRTEPRLSVRGHRLLARLIARQIRGRVTGIWRPSAAEPIQ